MRFKVDENLHSDVVTLLRQHGHDASSVYEQNLQGESDTKIASVCRQENRVILTLDLDFSNLLNFPPQDYSGILVIRIHDPNRQAVLMVLRRLLPLLEYETLQGCLWVATDSRLRIRKGKDIEEI